MKLTENEKTRFDKAINVLVKVCEKTNLCIGCPIFYASHDHKCAVEILVELSNKIEVTE